MKKKIIAIVAIVLVLAIGAGAIFLATAKESKQITLENLSTFYDVTVEITDYKEGEKSAEFLGLVSTYEASTAKIHIIATPKDKIVCDGAKLEYEFKDDFWNVVDDFDEDVSGVDWSDYIDETLQEKLQGKYDGFVGVDQFVAAQTGDWNQEERLSGRKYLWNPAMELNLRMTMGLVARNIYDFHRDEFQLGEGTHCFEPEKGIFPVE